MTMLLTTLGGPPARYMIAQYVPNPFRKETRNVGVVVEKDGGLAAKFIGETEPGKWDTGRLRIFDNPNAYRLWVDHWRKLIDRNGGSANLLSSRGYTFSVVSGGSLEDTGTDTPSDLCNYLYGRLVSAGGLAEALSGTADEEHTLALKHEINATFRANDLMAGSIFAKHPIYADRDVQGVQAFHRVAYYQELKHNAWAMEPVDFTIQRKLMARDHAAYARYVFSDLRKRSDSNGLHIETIAIVRSRPVDLKEKDVERGLAILEGTCRILNWSDPNTRDAFVSEREEIARAA